MFHRHVEALLDHRVLVVDVRSRSHNWMRACSLVNSLSHCFGLEAFLTCVENYCILQVLISRLIESLRSLWHLLVLIKARAWHLKFQRLTIEDLIIIEAR